MQDLSFNLRMIMNRTKIDYTKLANYTGISPIRLEKFEANDTELKEDELRILSYRLGYTNRI